MANPITQIIIAAVDRTKAAFASAKAGMDSIGNSAAGLKSALGSIFTVLSIGGFISKIKAVADELDNARKSAQASGTSVENFSALSYASAQSGGGPEVLQKSLVKLVQGLEQSRDASSKAAETWRSLGIDPKQFDDPADALLVIAERFAAMPDGIRKTNLAVDLFGEKIGPKMIPFLNAGRDGIKQLTDEAARLGLVFDTESTVAAEKLNDTLDKLNSRSTSVFAKMLPSLTEYVGAFDDIIERGSTLDKIKFFTTGYISEEVLNRINDAGDRVQDYNAKIFELQQQLLELRRIEGEGSPNIQIWEKRIADLETTRANLLKRVKRDSKETSDSWEEDRKAEADAFKKSTNEQINDAERLQAALQSAFSASISAERDYLRQAKKLRDEANATTTTAGDPESQALANLTAIAALMKLQRTAGTDSLESVQDQTQALRELAGQIDDAAKKAEYLKAANLAEAKALEAAAAEENARYTELATQQDETQRRAVNLKGALEGIGKEVSVEIKIGPQTDAALAKLKEIKSVIEFIKASGPVQASVSVPGTATASADLKTAALQYGRRG